MTAKVIASGLSHRFPGTGTLFSGLTMELAAGEVVALVGPSGSGKSTLLSILAGWLAPASGSVERHDIDHTAWVFQNPHGVPRRTAIDHVRLPLLARGLSPKEAHERASETMARFAIDAVANRLFRELSGGEAQRLMLARAAATGSSLLLVDEPTAQLDMHTARTVSDALTHLGAADAIVVVATHDPHARDACSRVIDLADYQGEDE